MVSEYSLYPVTNTAEFPSGVRLRTVTVPKQIYDSYVRLYNSAALLSYSLDTVLNHKDHQNVMNMGTAMGLCMPVERDFRAQNDTLKQCLNAFGTDEIDSLIFDKKGSVVAVRLPFNTAAGFHHTAIGAARIISMTMNSFYNRDYQSCFKQLKEDGKPYQGPVSFKKVSETWRVLLATCAAQKEHAPEEKLPANWIECSPVPGR